MGRKSLYGMRDWSKLYGIRRGTVCVSVCVCLCVCVCVCERENARGRQLEQRRGKGRKCTWCVCVWQ